MPVSYAVHRIDRRRLAQVLAGAGLSLPILAANQPLRMSAAQSADRSLLNVANEAEPSSLDPYLRGYFQSLVTRQIYEPLVEVRMTLADDGSSDVIVEQVPVLAESWTRPDPLTWRFTLRQGVTFHNGETFDANAIKASYDVMSDTDVAAQAGAYSILGLTTGLTVIDDSTIEVTTSVQNEELLGYYLGIGLVALPPALLASDGIPAFAEQPVGTGPYQFTSWERGQAIELASYPDYWNTDNVSVFDRVVIVSRPESAVRAQSISSGEADFAYNIGAEQASALNAFTTGGGFQSTSLRLNNQISPTNDQNVRLAINHAIDRQAICDSIFLGQATPAAFFGFQPVSVEPYAYDPELAHQLISDAGVEGAELELVYGEGRIPEEDQLAEIYRSYLEAVGLRIKLTKVEAVRYNEIGEQAFADQPPIYMETTSSGNYGEIAGGLEDKYGTEGTGTFSDPAFDARFEELQTLNGDDRSSALQSIAEDLHALAPRAWVAVVQQVHGISDKLNPNLPLNVFIHFTDLVD